MRRSDGPDTGALGYECRGIVDCFEGALCGDVHVAAGGDGDAGDGEGVVCVVGLAVEGDWDSVGGAGGSVEGYGDGVVSFCWCCVDQGQRGCEAEDG